MSLVNGKWTYESMNPEINAMVANWMDREDDDVPATDISERYRCFVPGQCQEYSLNFKKVDDADACHKFAGKEGEAVNWWSFEPAQSLCVLFGNCTEAGGPDQIICPDCISGKRVCPARECHGAFKCKGIFIDSFEIEYLEDCIQACNDNDICMWYTLEKTHDHCVLYENCDEKMDCDTCASGERLCTVGYHGPTDAPTTVPPTQVPTTTPAADPMCADYMDECDFDSDCCGTDMFCEQSMRECMYI